MIRIGKIAGTHGLQGDIILAHIVQDDQWLKKDDVLFLELNKGSLIPFFVTSAKPVNNDEYILRLEDVEQVEDAKKLVGKQVYVQENILVNKEKDSPLLWIGFNIVDKEKGSLGKIEDVMQTAHQWIAMIHYEGKEVLIPLIDQMILDVNKKNKFIRMDLPNGLLEL